MEKIKQQHEIILMNKEELAAMQQAAAETGAKAALQTLEEEKRKMNKGNKDRRLRNTKLLLRNYRMLKISSEESVYSRSQIKESAADVLCSMMNMYNDEVIVDAIKRSASRTAIMVSHIDTMLGLYRAYCEKNYNELDLRRYEVIYDLYIKKEPMTVIAIAKKQNMSKENVYSDVKIAVEMLSALIFGVDGLNAR